MVRLDEGVYSALKAQASKEGITLNFVVYALMHTANDCSTAKKQLLSLESQILNLSNFFSRAKIEKL